LFDFSPRINLNDLLGGNENLDKLEVIMKDEQL